MLPLVVSSCCFTNFNNNIKFSKQTTIAIQPLDFADKNLLSALTNEIESYYHFNVILLDNITIYKEAYYPPRNRYRADKLINILKLNKPVDANYIIGITTNDISTTKGNIPDFGIMGLGFCPGKSCVVSTFRLRTTNRVLLKNRLLKIALHEIGHNLGLPHCIISDKCMMHDAEANIHQIDKENLELCSHCKKKIGYNS